MRKIFKIILVIAAITLICCKKDYDADSSLKLVNSKVIDAGTFTFELPNDFQKIDALGIDSYVGKYINKNIEISFDFGLYSNDFSTWPESTKYQEIEIDEHNAIIGTLEQDPYREDKRHSTQVYFPKVKYKNNYVKLSMYATCFELDNILTAHEIFKSIKFEKTN